MPGIIGKKIGMSQIYQEDGSVVPVTYLHCVPNTVWQVKTEEKDGVNALVLGGEKLKNEKKSKKFKIMREFSGSGEYEKGQEVTVASFEDGERVTIVATSKGKGFQGQVRRHNFRVARKTHGTKDPRHGSTGACAMPGRTKPGLKMAGRMGNQQQTLRDRQVVLVDAGKDVIAIKGPVPGAKNGFVIIKKQG